MASPRVWLVTGASSGFGRTIAELALSKGDKVFATLRDPAALADLQAAHGPSSLVVHALDVTATDQVPHAFRAAHGAFGRVDVVFNNAGTSLACEAEGTPPAVARALFEVNFWGAAAVATEAVRFFREENVPRGGLLLNVSSYFGVASAARLGYYAATKHALDGLTEALAAELDPSWGIKVIIVSPGVFRTDIRAKRPKPPRHPAYVTGDAQDASADSAAPTTFYPEGRVGDVRKAVVRIYEATLLSEPPLRLFLGNDALEGVKKKVASLQRDIEAYESWSDDLMEEGS